MIIPENAEHVWLTLYEFIDNPYGVAGLMGNLYAESAMNPMNLQNSYERSLGMSDEEYTKRVDNNTYPNFVSDKAGYGLAQWTNRARKQNMLALSKATGKSIGDIDFQLSFLCMELQNYSEVLDTLHSTTSIEEASECVHRQYEKPASITPKSIQARIDFGQEFYNKFSETIPECIHIYDEVRVLKRGKNGKDVEQLQKNLIELGYDLGKAGADGIYGRKTHNAVLSFQYEHMLHPDGIAGTITQAIILETLMKIHQEIKEADKEYDLKEQEEEQYYCITIKHLTEDVAEALFNQYEDYPVVLEVE